MIQIVDDIPIQYNNDGTIVFPTYDVDGFMSTFADEVAPYTWYAHSKINDNVQILAGKVNNSTSIIALAEASSEGGHVDFHRYPSETIPKIITINEHSVIVDQFLIRMFGDEYNDDDNTHVVISFSFLCHTPLFYHNDILYINHGNAIVTVKISESGKYVLTSECCVDEYPKNYEEMLEIIGNEEFIPFPYIY